MCHLLPAIAIDFMNSENKQVNSQSKLQFVTQHKVPEYIFAFYLDFRTIEFRHFGIFVKRTFMVKFCSSLFFRFEFALASSDARTFTLGTSTKVRFVAFGEHVALEFGMPNTEAEGWSLTPDSRSGSVNIVRSWTGIHTLGFSWSPSCLQGHFSAFRLNQIRTPNVVDRPR